jgi:FkbM family methyltransferase
MLGSVLTRIGVAARIRGLLLSERDFLTAGGRMPAGIGVLKILRHPTTVEIPIRVARFISPRDRIHLVDVGANTGVWAERLLGHFPNSTAELWEPLPDLAKHLRKTFSDRTRFHVIDSAASSQAGKTTLIAPQHGAMASLHRYADFVTKDPLHGQPQPINIETQRLDDHVRDVAGRKVILKIDAQGHELEILEGARNLLQQVDLAIVESTIGPLFKDKTPTFSAVCGSMAKHDLLPVMLPSAGTMFGNYPIEQDIIFVRSDMVKALSAGA